MAKRPREASEDLFGEAPKYRNCCCCLLLLQRYHPYFVFEDTSIGGPSLYIVNQRAARAVRRAMAEDARLEKTYRTKVCVSVCVCVCII